MAFYTLRSVGILSCAKIMGAIYGCLGLIILPLLIFGSFATLIFGRDSNATSGFVMFTIAILIPILYGAMGFVMGAFTAWIYNLFANWIGGFEFELCAKLGASPTAANTPSGF